MGYYTDYKIDIINREYPITKEEYCPILDKLVNRYGMWGKFNDIGEISIIYTKWYTHEENMKEFSLKHPNFVFKLTGEGENSGDIWTKYFKNGKMQICEAKILFDDYEESKLI